MDTVQHFEGLEESERDDLQYVTQQIFTYMKDLTTRERKGRELGDSKLKLTEAIKRFVELVDGFLARPRPTKPTGANEIDLDDQARQLVRDIHGLVKELKSNGPPYPDELSNELKSKGMKLLAHYKTKFAESNADERVVWVPEREEVEALDPDAATSWMNLLPDINDPDAVIRANAAHTKQVHAKRLGTDDEVPERVVQIHNSELVPFDKVHEWLKIREGGMLDTVLDDKILQFKSSLEGRDPGGTGNEDWMETE